ncbi:hypothetical protein ACO0RG_004451 [Hanseniaspora osmophila]
MTSLLNISSESIKEKLLSIQATGYYKQLEPKEIKDVYTQCKTFMKFYEHTLTPIEQYAIMELVFHLALYMSEDLECEKIYKSFFDKFGNNSPYMHYFRSLLQQINNFKKIDTGAAEDSMVVEKSIESLIEEILEVETDQIDYLIMCKRFLSMKRQSISKEIWIKIATGLIEKFPMDTEMWYQLGCDYFELSNFDQAIYCLEEVILLTPHNFVAWSKLGEVYYYKSLSIDDNNSKIKEKTKEKNFLLNESLNRFLKSVEYSENFMKSWCYITVICNKLLSQKNSDTSNNSNNNKQQLFELGKVQLEKYKKQGFMNESDKKACKAILSSL